MRTDATLHLLVSGEAQSMYILINEKVGEVHCMHAPVYILRLSFICSSLQFFFRIYEGPRSAKINSIELVLYFGNTVQLN